jgi:histone deacetylase 1/2
MDADTAFLNAVLSDSDPAVYIEPPIGFDFITACKKNGFNPTNPRLKLRLRRALYGLKQSPRAWYETLHKFLISEGFQPLISDVCLYVKVFEGRRIIMAIYVDDIYDHSS